MANCRRSCDVKSRPKGGRNFTRVDSIELELCVDVLHEIIISGRRSGWSCCDGTHLLLQFRISWSVDRSHGGGLIDYWRRAVNGYQALKKQNLDVFRWMKYNPGVSKCKSVVVVVSDREREREEEWKSSWWSMWRWRNFDVKAGNWKLELGGKQQKTMMKSWQLAAGTGAWMIGVHQGSSKQQVPWFHVIVVIYWLP